ncbi:MAG: hypothetical protein WC716_08375 [Chitinophagaceae bacterium]|jgi:hypothetical protein
MKKLLFVPLALCLLTSTSCVKKIIDDASGGVKDRQCDCTYTSSTEPEKKESTTIKNKNQWDGETDCDKLSGKYTVDGYYGTCLLSN